MLYLNTIGLVLQNYTELFFTLLIVSSVYFSQINKKFSLFVSGILLGGAIAVRPLGWALLLSFITIQLLASIKTKKIIFDYFLIYAGTLIFIVLFGLFTYSHFGRFEYTATTGPVNLLIGANDDATGGFNSIIYEKGKAGYLENPGALTYLEKSEFYREQALEWIAKHPVKWVSLAPLKLLHSFGWDDIALSSLLGYHEINFGRALKNLITGNDSSVFISYFLFLSLNHIYYYLIIIAIVLGIFQVLKSKWSNFGIKIIFIYSLISILIIMITVGTPRYKYPVFILLLPFAASYFHIKFGTEKQVSGNEK
jgi:hypothetical protein